MPAVVGPERAGWNAVSGNGLGWSRGGSGPGSRCAAQPPWGLTPLQGGDEVVGEGKGVVVRFSVNLGQAPGQHATQGPDRLKIVQRCVGAHRGLVQRFGVGVVAIAACSTVNCSMG